MKVCIPIIRKENGTSVVYPHLATAPLYLYCDTETGRIEEINNKYSPFKNGEPEQKLTLNDLDIDTLVVFSMGESALSHFKQKGIKVLKCLEKTVTENLTALKNNELKYFLISEK
ncbi:MAG: hypothetical protein COA79_04835 [Planctomycetota bacterium]|nr:MAG: hypothetical protein COA79_04835 [Planctomycetota bacterium]